MSEILIKKENISELARNNNLDSIIGCFSIKSVYYYIQIDHIIYRTKEEIYE